MKNRRVRSSFLSCCCHRASGQAADYQLALPGYHYEFPRDHFNHPDYQTEWWYYTGNLKAADGHRFGFELTFFRQAVARDRDRRSGICDDLYMAHLALSDLRGIASIMTSASIAPVQESPASMKTPH